jgi:hypothetical protein
MFEFCAPNKFRGHTFKQFGYEVRILFREYNHSAYRCGIHERDGVLTGRGADFIIIDDPLKPEEALSETQRQAVNEWYDHTLYSRLNDKQTGCIIIIMQRLHKDDLVGHVLEQEDWELSEAPRHCRRR